MGFDNWMEKNFDPGLMAYLEGELGMDTAEIDSEFQIWRSFSSATDPPFYEGIEDVLIRFVELGGYLAVVSHSEADVIRRNYASATKGKLLPNLVYGWEHDAEKRKPNPWPVRDILERLDLAPAEVLVVDDLKPGVDMARAAGVAVAGAGWAYDIPSIRDFMSKACDFYFSGVEDFRGHLFGAI